jgi:tetratricopeptide (TPR) repeat protein
VAETVSPEAARTLDFAESLLEEGDHYRAIGEYKRALFLGLEDAPAAQARYRIGVAYLRGEQPSAAAEHYARLIPRSGPALKPGLELQLAYALALGGEALRAQAALSSWLAAHDSDPEVPRARYLLGWSWISLEHPVEAFAQFTALPDFDGKQSLLDGTASLETLPRKSPLTAGLLSAVPGLGHVYLGQPLIGLAALLWNGLFSFALVHTLRTQQWGAAAVLGALEATWYAGTVFGAVSGAHKHNRDARLNAIEALRFDPRLERWPPTAKTAAAAGE